MAEAQRLEELKLSAVESRLDARLALRADAELPKGDRARDRESPANAARAEGRRRVTRTGCAQLRVVREHLLLERVQLWTGFKAELVDQLLELKQ